MKKNVLEEISKEFSDDKLKEIANNSVLKTLKEAGIQLPQPLLSEVAVHSDPVKFKQVSEFSSEKSKVSHQALYEQFLEAFNTVSIELDSELRKSKESNSQHSLFRSLKLDEISNLNAKWLHELFFGGFFDPHSELVMNSLAYMKLEREWGVFDDWQKDFMACANSCGNGWAVMGYHTHLKKYINTTITNYSQDVMIGLIPVLVLDMYEHAYNRDYLTDKASWINARMREIDWNFVEDRINKCEAIAQALK